MVLGTPKWAIQTDRRISAMDSAVMSWTGAASGHSENLSMNLTKSRNAFVNGHVQFKIITLASAILSVAHWAAVTTANIWRHTNDGRAVVMMPDDALKFDPFSLFHMKHHSMSRTYDGIKLQPCSSCWVVLDRTRQQSLPFERTDYAAIPGRYLEETKKIFSCRLSCACRVIENAFSILGAKWRIFQGKFAGQPHIVEKMVLGTVALHNFLMVTKQLDTSRYCTDTFVDQENSGVLLPAWGRSSTKVGKIGSNNSARAAINARNQLAFYFVSPYGDVLWQYAVVNRGWAMDNTSITTTKALADLTLPLGLAAEPALPLDLAAGPALLLDLAAHSTATGNSGRSRTASGTSGRTSTAVGPSSRSSTAVGPGGRHSTAVGSSGRSTTATRIHSSVVTINFTNPFATLRQGRGTGDQLETKINQHWKQALGATLEL
ncbi:hypothetical protein PR048_015924 [Dryococelus australis]|uniref:DDE Tnp4 domain-containing protein n=1 Tax=Dryococelus australis TaxID=614101 RepID=A0ABQ9HIB1_9NEOP|nr:hypothetical protein PR048_015924 [Dryococelus australis]